MLLSMFQSLLQMHLQNVALQQNGGFSVPVANLNYFQVDLHSFEQFSK